jgi:hypothetical protein
VSVWENENRVQFNKRKCYFSNCVFRFRNLKANCETINVCICQHARTTVSGRWFSPRKITAEISLHSLGTMHATTQMTLMDEKWRWADFKESLFIYHREFDRGPTLKFDLNVYILNWTKQNLIDIDSRRAPKSSVPSAARFSSYFGGTSKVYNI